MVLLIIRQADPMDLALHTRFLYMTATNKGQPSEAALADAQM